jgi:hypothetical protein
MDKNDKKIKKMGKNNIIKNDKLTVKVVSFTDI